MKICPSCQIHYPDDAAVCGQCGARLMLDSSSQPDPQQSMVGRVIGGNYKIEGLLGKGGMGAVFRARQLSLDREVAVKVLLAPLAMEGEMIERFQREARSASNIGHPSIVQVIDLGYLEEGPPFIAMELLEGEDLRSKLSREGALPPAQAIPLMLQVCDGLQAAHDKGIVHRDLKPDNLFLVYRQGKVPTAKLLDFGLSKIKSADRKLTNTGALLGTPNYMSPEQVKAEREVDSRADVYAIGAILYEMLSGKPAYDGASVQSILVSIMTEDPAPPRSIRPDMPEELEAVILKAMARDPQRRHQSMNELGVELARVGAQLGVPQSQLSLFSSPSSPALKSYETPTQLASAPVPTPPYTPPPISVPASSVVRQKKPSGILRFVIGGVLALIAVGVVAVVLGGVVIAAIALLMPRPEIDEEKAQVLEGIFDDLETAIEAEVMEELEEEFGVKPKASGPPGHELGQGQNPHMCCGKKGCAVVYQTELESGTVINMARLKPDLSPIGEPVAVSPEDDMNRWPVCFADKGGGYLVFYQESRDPFDMSAVVKIHRLFVSADGKPGKRQTLAARNMIAIDEFEATFAASQSGDKVVLAWNHMKGVSSGIRFAVFNMNGTEAVPETLVHKKPTVHATSLACGPERCLVAWTRPSLPMNHKRKFAIVTPAGKVIEADMDVWDRGIMVQSMTVVPMKGGAAMAWNEQDSKGNSTPKIAMYGWDGKEKLEPTTIKEFKTAGSLTEHLGYVAGTTDGATIAISRIVPDKDSGEERVLTVLVDGKGKVTSSATTSLLDDDIYDASVFFAADGTPVLIYGVGSWGSDQVLHVLRLEMK
ncbi:MAG: serine/threonine protein kinase [Deltaproteobacteria bacterium]|nr:serine/threonine protein kinase [Deltaproteobacteria bacterium]